MISVSYISSIYPLDKTIKMLENIEDVDYIHLDLMDGLYCGEKNFDIDNIIDLFKDCKKPLDVHLMVKNPENYIDDLLKINPKRISFHPDATINPKKVLETIKSHGIEAGVAINSYIELNSYESLYDFADSLLIMSVKAGAGGQKFLNSTYKKIENIESIKDNHHVFIEIDGGINKKIYSELLKYPIDIFVVGSYIVSNEKFERPIKELLK